MVNTDLRVGNLVHPVFRNVHQVDKPAMVEIVEIMSDYATVEAIGEEQPRYKLCYKNMRGIIITPEILFCLGFDKRQRQRGDSCNGDGCIYVKSTPTYSISIIANTETVGFRFSYNDVMIVVPHILYLHQAQNLIFGLTGDELKLLLMRVPKVKS